MGWERDVVVVYERRRIRFSVTTAILLIIAFIMLFPVAKEFLPREVFSLFVPLGITLIIAAPPFARWLSDRRALAALREFAKVISIGGDVLTLPSELGVEYGMFRSKGFRGKVYHVKNKFSREIAERSMFIQLSTLKRPYTIVSSFSGEYISVPAARISDGKYKDVIICVFSPSTIRLNVEPRRLEVSGRGLEAEAELKSEGNRIRYKLVNSADSEHDAALVIYSKVKKKLGILDILPTRTARFPVARATPGMVREGIIEVLPRRETIVITHRKLFTPRKLVDELSMPIVVSTGFHEGQHKIVLKPAKILARKPRAEAVLRVLQL